LWIIIVTCRRLKAQAIIVRYIKGFNEKSSSQWKFRARFVLLQVHLRELAWQRYGASLPLAIQLIIKEINDAKNRETDCTYSSR
jgi:hypothetical protein